MQPLQREAGFTWVRVVVALGIVVTSLIGLLNWSILTGGCKDSATRTEAAAYVRNIVNALKSYYNDYGHFPEIQKSAPGGKAVFYVGDSASKVCELPNSVIFDVLRAIPRGANTDHALNPRRIKYFEGAKAKDLQRPRKGFADGSRFPENVQGCLFDPWGHQYCIVFTTDGSDQVDISTVYSDSARPENSLRSPVGAFSLGDDGIVGSKQYPGRLYPRWGERPNDTVSWQ